MAIPTIAKIETFKYCIGWVDWVFVRITDSDGAHGWGEGSLHGPIRPVLAAIEEYSAHLIGEDASGAERHWHRLYNAWRWRGGPVYMTALSAIDIALWDIAGRQADKPVSALLGGTAKASFPAYVSGLPEPTMEKRAELARHWQDRGFDAFKFATPVADDGPAAELENLRAALGGEAKIAADMHWNQTAEEALALIEAMKPHGLWFAEAPVRTEDIAALEKVSKGTDVAIAVGEEWRTVWDMRHRIERCDIAIVQPEMGHKGITNFTRIGALAAERDIQVIPHATIGAGIFLAASLQASSTLPTLAGHEFQHSIFEPNRRLLVGDMDCREGTYRLPAGPGLGVEPSREALELLQPI